MKCELEVLSVNYEVWSVNYEVWSVKWRQFGIKTSENVDYLVLRHLICQCYESSLIIFHK